MKPIKNYLRNKAILVGGGILLLLAVAVLLTHAIASWSADESQSENIRIQNLLTMQKDSIESEYALKRIALLDSTENQLLEAVTPLKEENGALKRRISEKDKTIVDLKEKFKQNPTLENCTQLVEKQEIKIEEQKTLITGLEKEAQEWCELYENENTKGIDKDSIIARKDRTIATQNSQLSTMRAEISIVDKKLNDPSSFKRNWKWATGSYRDWLRDRDVEKFLKEEAGKK